MKLLYDLFGQLYEVRVFSEWIRERVIFQKSVVGIIYGYSIFLVISFRIIDARYSEFLIICLLIMLSIIRISFIFGILAYSRRAIKYVIHRKFYCEAVLSGHIIRHRSKIYTEGSAEDIYISIIVQPT